jgi:DeoR/GlpR family transcriptional regulator of sugar metabolism
LFHVDTRNAHLPVQRRQIIIDELNTLGSVRVDDLSRLFDVSEMTVRRDLDSLESEGLLERAHGGAIALHAVTSERRYREKDEENRGAKEAIARVASEMVEDGETVLINSGSTTRQVINSLARRRGVRIVTNNVAAVSDLPDDIEAEIMLLGGRFRGAAGCVVGDWAVRLMEDLAPARAILGADGIRIKEGMSSPIPEEAALTRLMIERTRGPVIVVADAGKVGKVCGFHIAPLSAIDTLICDAGSDAPRLNDLEMAGVEIIKAN